MINVKTNKHKKPNYSSTNKIIKKCLNHVIRDLLQIAGLGISTIYMKT